MQLTFDKKKVICDILTFSRFFLGLAILAIAIFNGPAFPVLVLNALGLITDALDGIAHKRWKYTENDISRLPKFWQRLRKNPQLLDALTDGVLLFSSLIYILFRAFHKELADLHPALNLPIVIFSAILSVDLFGTWLVQNGRGNGLYRLLFAAQMLIVISILTFAAFIPQAALCIISFLYVPAALLFAIIKRDRLKNESYLPD